MTIRVHPIKAGMAWCHLVECNDGLILVDAGSRGHHDKILARARALGKPLRLLFITHAHLDHYGSAAAIRRATGVPVAIHRADAGDMARGATRVGTVRLWGHLVKRMLPLVERIAGPEPLEADVIVDEGDDLSRWGFDARVLHTPGHTPGSCTLLTGDSTAFVGDLVSPMLFPHPQMIYATDWEQLAASVRRVQALSPARVYCGHGGAAMGGEAFRRIRPLER